MTDGGGFTRPMRGAGTNPLMELPDLFNAALDEFSIKSFDEASLNDIIRASNISKGSFYYRFADKTDLYLCLIDRIKAQKLAYFAQKQTDADFPSDFFEQIKTLAAAGLEYARHEPRYYSFFRRFLSETGAVRQAVRKAFPDAGMDNMLMMVQAARAAGKLREDMSDEFISGMLQLMLNNIDTLLRPDMSDDEIEGMIRKLASMFETGIARQ